MIEVVEQAPCVRDHSARAHALDGGVRERALAEHGLLCGDCFRRLEYRLDDLPEIIRQARLNVVPGVGGGGGSEPVSGTKERRLPFDVGALEDADALFSMLANWTTAVARALGVKPPTELAGVHAADANVNGLASWSTPAAAADTAEGAVRWLLAHLEAAAGLRLIGDLCDELVPAVERAHGRWLVDSGSKTRRRDRPCPVCGSDLVRVGWDGHQASMWCRKCLLPLPVDWKGLT